MPKYHVRLTHTVYEYFEVEAENTNNAVDVARRSQDIRGVFNNGDYFDYKKGAHEFAFETYLATPVHVFDKSSHDTEAH